MASVDGVDKSELKQESEKLHAKYPGLVNNASSLLHRRLSKNVKYFDSGDYNMAKSRPLVKDSFPSGNLDSPTGDTIPTVDNISVLRSKSISLQNNTTILPQSTTACTTPKSNSTSTTTCRYITIPARTQVAK
ncbi:unnamed protein product [Schistosoma mattheei]|uniref:Uncharacterized protein n=1 Tax=Schistosoma mattheei TaxID=31246 RepID=A0A183PYJ3_9TREM|nr:unnamed protein product [Schistosoma mattheei]